MIKRKSPIKRSPVKRSGKPIKKRAKPLNRVNHIRKATSFARAYHSHERVRWVKSLPCSACGVEAFSENAHLTPVGEKGTGYKGDARFIAPLCGMRGGWWPERGCHILFDRFRDEFNTRFPEFDPVRAAADCEAAWLAHSNPATPEREPQ